MSEVTTFPHEDLIKDNNINVADLSEKTRSIMEEFKNETNDVKKDGLDELLYMHISDFIEKQKAKMKAEENKKKVEAHKAEKKKKVELDVSQAETAKAQTPPPAEPAKKTVIGTILGV